MKSSLHLPLSYLFEGDLVQSKKLAGVLVHDPAESAEVLGQDGARLGPRALQSRRVKPCLSDSLLIPTTTFRQATDQLPA